MDELRQRHAEWRERVNTCDHLWKDDANGAQQCVSCKVLRPAATDLVDRIQRLHLTRDDVLIVRVGMGVSAGEAMRVMEGIKRLDWPMRIPAILIRGDVTTLEAVSEDRMRELGWVRAPKEPSDG